MKKNKKSAKPTKPTKPTEPVKPVKPVKPTKPVKPVKSTKLESKKSVKAKKEKTLLSPVDSSLLPVSSLSSLSSFVPIENEAPPSEPSSMEDTFESEDLNDNDPAPKNWWDKVKEWFVEAYHDLF